MKPGNLLAAAAIALAAGCACAQSDSGPVRIGFITDKSSLYADIDGPAGAEVINWAVQDFGGKVLGRPVEVLSADHQNKADQASLQARQWMDNDNLAVLFGGGSSGANLVMAQLALARKRPFISIGGATARLTNEECSPYTIHYAYDTVALAKVAGTALVKAGYKTWYFLTADYAFGHSLQADAAEVVQANGGTVVGSTLHPLNASDFSSFLLQAQASKAQILALANAGGDFTNTVKAAKAFGIDKTMKIAGLLVFVNDVHSLGLANTAGLQLADSWYWDQSEGARKFGARFFERFKRMPSSVQAANYSATINYLEAVAAAGTTDGEKVMTVLKSKKYDDFYAKGYVRADGRMIHDMYLFQVKTPAESTRPWDYYKLVATVPGEQAFTSMADSKCPLLKK